MGWLVVSKSMGLGCGFFCLWGIFAGIQWFYWSVTLVLDFCMVGTCQPEVDASLLARSWLLGLMVGVVFGLLVPLGGICFLGGFLCFSATLLDISTILSKSSFVAVFLIVLVKLSISLIRFGSRSSQYLCSILLSSREKSLQDFSQLRMRSFEFVGMKGLIFGRSLYGGFFSSNAFCRLSMCNWALTALVLRFLKSL